MNLQACCFGKPWADPWACPVAAPAAHIILQQALNLRACFKHIWPAMDQMTGLVDQAVELLPLFSMLSVGTNQRSYQQAHALW